MAKVSFEGEAMRNRFLLSWVFILAVSSSAFASKSSSLVNRIEGRVYSPQHLPVENIYVELRNEVGSPVGQTKTDSSGRYSFSGMPAGRYVVKVLPLGTKFTEQTQEVYVTNLSRSSSDFVYADFYLTYEKRASTPEIEKTPGVIFVQDIPKPAKKLFEEGVDELKKFQEKGLDKLEAAIKVFPEYFDALSLLGQEYVTRGSYEKAYPYLLRAIDVNPRSSISFYRLAYAFYQLKQYPAALEAAKAAVILVPNSIDALQLYGTILRINGNYADAEKALLKAGSLAKGKNSEIHFQLALLYNRLKRNQDAIDELEIYLKLVPNSPDKSKIQELIVKLKSSSKQTQK